MKHLYVLRHAKAGQTNKRLINDRERHLTDKGLEQCPLVAEYFKSQGVSSFDLVISSPAIRAMQTVESILSALGADTKAVTTVPNLYLATTTDLFNIIQDIDSRISNVLLVGHNPGLQQFCIQFSGKGDKKKFREMRNNFPPASLASFELEKGSWRDAAVQTGTLVDFTTTKQIKVLDEASLASAAA